MSLQSDFVREVFLRAWRQRHRLQTGLKAREAYCNDILIGKDITGNPRGKAMQQAADLLKGFLFDIAKEYDAKNPEDKLSTKDAIDILKLVARSFV